VEGLTAGRIVHYVLSVGPNAGEHVPAIVVRAWPGNGGRANLQVFYDGTNDYPDAASDGAHIIWAPSTPYSEEPEPGTWHWIERA
jgi:hypothetical protein